VTRQKEVNIIKGQSLWSIQGVEVDDRGDIHLFQQNFQENSIWNISGCNDFGTCPMYKDNFLSTKREIANCH
jgi:hypothetical protein